jgi:hypothetical protein
VPLEPEGVALALLIFTLALMRQRRSARDWLATLTLANSGARVDRLRERSAVVSLCSCPIAGTLRTGALVASLRTSGQSWDHFHAAFIHAPEDWSVHIPLDPAHLYSGTDCSQRWRPCRF